MWTWRGQQPDLSLRGLILVAIGHSISLFICSYLLPIIFMRFLMQRVEKYFMTGIEIKNSERKLIEFIRSIESGVIESIKIQNGVPMISKVLWRQEHLFE